MQEGQPVPFMSRALMATEKNYAQIEKILLVIVHAWEWFDQYLESDHKPLEAILKTTTQSPEETPRNDDVLAKVPAKSCLQESPRDVHRRHLEHVLGVPTLNKPYLTE